MAGTADRISAGSAVATAVMAVAAGIVAAWTLIQLKRDSRERTRPVMTAQLRPRLLAHGIVELAIANVGQSAAKDIQVVFNPPLPENEHHLGQASMASFIRRRYARPIPTLAPGQELINVYGHFVGNGEHRLDEEGVPYDVTVSFSYTDSTFKQSWWAPWREPYTDQYQLTVDTLVNQTMSTPANHDERGIQRRWITALETIARGVGAH